MGVRHGASNPFLHWCLPMIHFLPRCFKANDSDTMQPTALSTFQSLGCGPNPSLSSAQARSASSAPAPTLPPLIRCPGNSWRLSDARQGMSVRVRDEMEGKRTFDAHTPVSINASGPSSSHILLRYSGSIHPKTSGRGGPDSPGGVEGASSESGYEKLSSLSRELPVLQLGCSSTSGLLF